MTIDVKQRIEKKSLILINFSVDALRFWLSYA